MLLNIRCSIFFVPVLALCMPYIGLATSSRDEGGEITGLKIDNLAQELSGPVVVTTHDHVNFQGILTQVKHDQLVLQENIGEGSVEYAVDFAKIKHIEFPGTHYISLSQKFLANDDYPNAIVIIDALFKQRAQLLQWQSSAALEFFTRHAETHLNHGSLNNAIQIARQLQAHTDAASLHQKLDDILLLAHHRLGFAEQAHALSKQWIQTRPAYGQSALGWYVQADLMRVAEDYDQALNIALDPIVFSSQFPMAYLEHCYAIAIIAATALHETEHAQALWVEMQERNLKWPGLSGLENPRAR